MTRLQTSPALDYAPLTDFIPRRALRNPHLQTLAGAFAKRPMLLGPHERRIVRVPDPELDIRLVVFCHFQPNKTAAPTVILIHGMEGSAESGNVIGLGNKAWAAGMNVVRMNMRTCGGTDALSPTLYNSGMYGVVLAVIRDLAERDGLKQIGVIGYSMGGNLTMNLVGHLGSEEQFASSHHAPHGTPEEFVGAAVICPAMDVDVTADAFHEPQNRIYEWDFLRKLKQRYKRKCELFPDRYDVKRLRGTDDMRSFDRNITSYYFGWGDDEQGLYTHLSSSRVAEHVKLPTLVIHAADDPFVRLRESTKAKLHANPSTTFVETQHGGHCAFLADPDESYDGRWAERETVRFMEMVFRQKESRRA